MTGDNLIPHDGRDTRLQWIRSIGAILVVCLHSASEHMYSIGYGSAEWWFVNAINGLSRCAVPLFVMASGAVFLDKAKCDEDFAGFYSKRIKRIAVPLVFWTVIYIIFGILVNKVSLTNVKYFKNLLESLYNGKPYYHLWYLYMLIGLYLVIPFIQRLWAALTESQRLLFTAISFVMAAIAPFEGAFLPVDSGSPFFLLFRFLPYVGYFVCGHAVKTLVEQKNSKIPTVPILLAMATLAVVTIIGSFFAGSNKEPGKYFFHYLSVNVICFTILLFTVLMRKITAGSRPPAFIRVMDKVSLAVYLIHPMVLIFIGKLYRLWMPQGLMFDMFIIGKIITALAASILLGMLMMKIPFLRKTV